MIGMGHGFEAVLHVAKGGVKGRFSIKMANKCVARERKNRAIGQEFSALSACGNRGRVLPIGMNAGKMFDDFPALGAWDRPGRFVHS